jgi:hypothetical protein
LKKCEKHHVTDCIDSEGENILSGEFYQFEVYLLSLISPLSLLSSGEQAGTLHNLNFGQHSLQ